MNKVKFKYVTLFAIVGLAAALLYGLSRVLAATAPNLGSTSTYAVVSSTFTNSNTAPQTIINGDVCYTTAPVTPPLLITGATNVIQQPEFEDPEKFQSVIELIEDKDIIIHIMDKKKSESINSVLISIGHENEDEKLNEYSLITKKYTFGETSGTVGIIGPKRMEYSKVVAIVSYLGDMLSEVLTGNK